MERGTKALSPQIHPRAYLVWRFMGLDQLLLLGDIPGAIRSYEMAANWAAESPIGILRLCFSKPPHFYAAILIAFLSAFKAGQWCITRR